MAVFQTCWYLTGPTASGKTAIGIELARRIGAEIVSMDSMALYRGMDIGTAKPSLADRLAVPHHLVDVLPACAEYSLAQYLAAAGQAVGEIRRRGREVLFVGGTPLYLKGLLRGIFEGPPADWPLRRELQEHARRHGPESLHRRLAEVDPTAAARLHPNDTRRLVRALEVYQKTGQPITHWQRQFAVGRPAGDCRVFALDWPRPELHARIDRRVQAMFTAGLIEEVRRLLAAAGGADILPAAAVAAAVWSKPLSRTASQAVGYREVIEHLQGKYTLPETIDLVRQHTRQLAKRQTTWFRSFSECRFVPMSATATPAAVAETIAALGQSNASAPSAGQETLL